MGAHFVPDKAQKSIALGEILGSLEVFGGGDL